MTFEPDLDRRALLRGLGAAGLLTLTERLPWRSREVSPIIPFASRRFRSKSRRAR